MASSWTRMSMANLRVNARGLLGADCQTAFYSWKCRDFKRALERCSESVYCIGQLGLLRLVWWSALALLIPSLELLVGTAAGVKRVRTIKHLPGGCSTRR